MVNVSRHNAQLEVPDWLRQRVLQSPGALAVAGGGLAWDFAELDRQAAFLAGRLSRLGVQPDDRVAVLMGNGLAFVAVVHALIKLRAILVPLNTRLAHAEMSWQLADVGATLLLYDARNADAVEAVTAAVPEIQQLLIDDAKSDKWLDKHANTAFSTPDRLDLRATHCIIYTSGTTGKPKGVLLTYGNHWWSAIGSALNLGLHAEDRWLAVLPLFHVGGLAMLMRGVIYAHPVFVHERFDPVTVNLALDEQQITIISVVANVLDRMLTEREDRPYPSTLRAVLLGGGPAPQPLLERCVHIGLPVVQTYGMTETASQAATLAPADALRKLGSAGKPLMPVELRIEANDVMVPVGTVGEIVVRGPNVTPGYADRPEATEQALRGGWLHTGDLGYLDEEGYLYVVDRRDDLIISGGENVYPAEVESVLLGHPSVADVAVVGLPDPRWGQTVGAAVVLHPGMLSSAHELIDFCKAQLAAYKAPAHISLRAELPRNAGGKIVRHAIRDTWRAQTDRCTDN